MGEGTSEIPKISCLRLINGNF
uniref:Uncharacterized protein n=1 Tax=Rhizophora mucronata TaxID=61149 RepID=A0A2P2R3S2_RHIMU